MVVHLGTSCAVGSLGTDQGAPGAPGRALNDLFFTSAGRGALRKAPRRDDSRGVLSTAPVLPPQAQGCVEVQSDASQGFVVLTVKASRRFTFQLTAFNFTLYIFQKIIQLDK